MYNRAKLFQRQAIGIMNLKKSSKKFMLLTLKKNHHNYLSKCINSVRVQPLVINSQVFIKILGLFLTTQCPYANKQLAIHILLW